MKLSEIRLLKKKVEGLEFFGSVAVPIPGVGVMVFSSTGTDYKTKSPVKFSGFEKPKKP